MFKNIHYDARKNKIYLLEHINGKDVKYQDDVEHYYYTEDKSKKSDITDIYGTPVTRHTTEDRKSIKTLADSDVKTFETDVNVEIKFLQDRYKNTKLKPDVKTFNIAYMDIEIAVGDSGFKPNHEIKIRKKNDQTH